MVASDAGANRKGSVDLIGWNPDKLMFELRKLTDGPTLFAPAHHEVLPADVNADRLEKIIRSAHEDHPQDFATLLGGKGVGPATVRALSLMAELIYDAPASHKDPADHVGCASAHHAGGRNSARCAQAHPTRRECLISFRPWARLIAPQPSSRRSLSDGGIPRSLRRPLSRDPSLRCGMTCG